MSMRLWAAGRAEESIWSEATATAWRHGVVIGIYPPKGMKSPDSRHATLPVPLFMLVDVLMIIRGGWVISETARSIDVRSRHKAVSSR